MNKIITCPVCGRKVFLVGCSAKDLRRALICENDVFSTKLGCYCGWQNEVHVRYSVSNGAITFKEIERYDLTQGQVMYGKRYRFAGYWTLGSYFPVLETDTIEDLRIFAKINSEMDIENCPERFKEIFYNLTSSDTTIPCIVANFENSLKDISFPWRKYIIEDGFFIVKEPAYEVITPYEVLETTELLKNLSNSIFHTRILYDVDIDRLGRVKSLTRELMHILKPDEKFLSSEVQSVRKVAFSYGMSGDHMLILTDAPKSAIEDWAREYNKGLEDDNNVYFKPLQKNYYVKVIADSEVHDLSWEDIQTIGFDESYDLGDYLDYEDN